MGTSFRAEAEGQAVIIIRRTWDGIDKPDYDRERLSIDEARTLAEHLIEAAETASKASLKAKQDRMAKLQEEIRAKEAERIALEVELRGLTRADDPPAPPDMTGIPLNHMV